MKGRFAVAVALFAVSLGCGRGRVTPSQARAPTAKIVSVGGATVRYLDWGGSGEPLVFVAGLGATAHAFDEFAPRFVGEFHVVAITRRDDASLASVPNAFATDTLADDLAVVLQRLALGPANVVAHSFGGAELTCLAVRHPDLVRRVVYLDAAYDHEKSLALYGKFPDVPPPPKPSPDDTKSPDAYVAYLDRIFGIRMPRSEAAASFVFAGDGARPALAAPVFQALTHEERLCAYSDVRVPALGVFAMLDTPGDLARFVRDDPEIARKTQPLFEALAARQREDVERFAREVKTREIVELHGASHWVFVSNAEEVERGMRRFLAK